MGKCDLEVLINSVNFFFYRSASFRCFEFARGVVYFCVLFCVCFCGMVFVNLFKFIVYGLLVLEVCVFVYVCVVFLLLSYLSFGEYYVLRVCVYNVCVSDEEMYDVIIVLGCDVFVCEINLSDLNVDRGKENVLRLMAVSETAARRRRLESLLIKWEI